MLETIIASGSALIGVFLGSLITHIGTISNIKNQKNLQLRTELRPIAARALHLFEQTVSAKTQYFLSRNEVSMRNTGKNREAAEADLVHWRHLYTDLQLALEELSILADLGPATSRFLDAASITLFEQQEATELSSPITPDGMAHSDARQEFLETLRDFMKI